MDDLEIDSNGYLYILDAKDVWRSTNSGVNWTKINDSFTTYSNDGFVMHIDGNDNLFIGDGNGRVWKSADLGFNWDEKGDFNGGSGSNAKGLTSFVQVSGPRSVTLIPIYAEDEFGGEITSDVDSLDGFTTRERVEVQTWSKNITSGAVNSVVGHCYALWIDSGAEIGFQVSLNGGGSWENESCVQTVIEDTDFSCDLKSNFGVDTASEVDNLQMRCTHPTAGSGDYYSVDYVYVDVNYNYSATSLDFEVRNCSSSDCSDGIWASEDLSSIDLVSQYFQYRTFFVSPDSSISPSLESVTLDYTLNNQAPNLNLVSPVDSANYGTNESLGLEFNALDSDGNLESCWYNIGGGSNVSLAECANTTFDVSGDGTYVLNIFANDSLGEESNDSATFSIQIGAPTIILNSPPWFLPE